MNLARNARARRNLAASAVSLVVLAFATGCSEAGEPAARTADGPAAPSADDPAAPPADESELGFHGVWVAYNPPLAHRDLTPEEALAEMEFAVSDSSTAAMAWFIAGDCSAPAPPTPEFAVACSHEGATVYLLEAAALTGADVESAETLKEGGLLVNFTDAGATVLAEFTAQAAAWGPPANQMAIVLDSVVISSPVVQGEITGGSLEIRTASRGHDWAALAAELNA